MKFISRKVASPSAHVPYFTKEDRVMHLCVCVCFLMTAEPSEGFSGTWCSHHAIWEYTITVLPSSISI